MPWDGGQVIHRFGEGAFEILRRSMADGRNREDDGGERTDVIVLIYLSSVRSDWDLEGTSYGRIRENR